jgi:hypothetical protein
MVETQLSVLTRNLGSDQQGGTSFPHWEGRFRKYPNVEGKICKLERWQGHF